MPASVGALTNDAAIVGFDPHRSVLVNAAAARTRVWAEDDTLVVRRDLCLEVAKATRLELRCNREAAGANVENELARCPPSLAPAVRGDGLRYQ